MAIQSQPSRISEPFAGSGTKNVIPATNSTPSASQAASWASGFPPECSQPISAGGCPVPRDDVNGVLNWLSQGFAFQQDGGIWEWSALADYDVQRIVRGSDGLLYYSKAQSGPGVAAGAQDPTADDGTYWVAPSFKTMPASDLSNAAATTNWVASWHSAMALPDTLYVDSVNGDDSNDGYTAATAKKTISNIISLIQNNLYTKPNSIKVNLADGTYTDTITGVPGIQIEWHGNSYSTILLGVNQSVNLTYGSVAILSGYFTVKNQINIYAFSVLQILNGASIAFSDINAVSGGIFGCIAGGLIRSPAGAVVSISFSNCTAPNTVLLHCGGLFDMSNSTWNFSGSVTGKRYTLEGCSVITGAGSPTKIPGTSSGTADSSCWYS